MTTAERQVNTSTRKILIAFSFSASVYWNVFQVLPCLKDLTRKINANQSLEYACGIILRSTLLDALIVLNLYNILIDNEASTKTDAEKEQIVKEFCDTLLSDGLENTLKYIKAAKDVNIITQQQLADTYKNFVAARQIF